MKFESQELTDTIRKNLGCSWVSLSSGKTRYILEGPVDGELLVCVHGFSMPSFVYDFSAEYFTGKGYRVLRYDLYGRGFSDRPDIPNNIEFFRKQLAELLNSLGLLQKQKYLIGLSMGGIIVSDFTVHYPESIRSVILLDSAGVPGKKVPVNPLIKIPVLGKALFRRIAPATMLKYALNNFYEQERFLYFRDLFACQMEYAGFFDSIYSTLMNLDLDGFSNTIATLGNLDIPKLIIWGEHDQVIDYSASFIFRNLLPGAGFYTVSECGHMPVYEKPDETNCVIFEFINQGYVQNN